MIKQLAPEVIERMRQHEVVCKIAIQLGLGGYTTGAKANRVSLVNLGIDEFGLTSLQSQTCVGRARDFVNNVSTSVSSETLLIRAKRMKRSWNYIDDNPEYLRLLLAA